MRFWRKRRRVRMRPYVAPPEAPLAPIEHIVDDGMLIARSSAAMELKNWIIVQALRNGEAFDTEAAAEEAKRELGRLAEEQADYATRIEDTRRVAFQKRGGPRHQHDYRSEDLSALSRRGEIYTTLSEQLGRVKNDEEFVAELVETARVNAWEDLSREVESKLDRVADEPVVDEAYRRARGQRLRRLREIDFAKLFEEMEGKAEAGAGASGAAGKAGVTGSGSES